MDSRLANLSDDELRIRLLQYGFKNIPITQTTRKTLIKKLRLFMENASNDLRKTSSFVSKYSSEEDDDDASFKKNHRKTTSTSYVSPVFINDDNGVSKKSFFANNNTPSPANSTRRIARNDDYDNDENLKLKDCTRRLLQFRKTNIQNGGGGGGGARLTTTTTAPRSDNINNSSFASNFASVVQNSKRNLNAAKQTLVPMILIGFLICFFIFLIFMYINMSPNIEKNFYHSISYDKNCPLDDNNSPHCIDESNMDSMLNMLKIVTEKLQAKSSSHACKRSAEEMNIWCVNEILDYLNGAHDMVERGEIAKILQNLQHLIDRNSLLGISNVDKLGEKFKIKENVDLQETCFALENQKSPLYCSFYIKANTFFTIVGSLSILGALAFALNKFHKFVVDLKIKRKHQMEHMIDTIIRYVKERASMETEKFVVVNYMKDDILMQSRNSELCWAWTNALEHLEKNDSRLHFGLKNVNGEDLKIIQWVQAVKKDRNESQESFSSSFKSSNESKLWLGPAFDKSNRIKNPPTNCLKIRQMFEKHEIDNPNLSSFIRENIVMKVREKGCKILAIELDKKTCCVYVKCATCSDAGIIHEEMNGWWFDQRLIVVKFLREDKFHQRFPSNIDEALHLDESDEYSS